jgi:hypothetical protein
MMNNVPKEIWAIRNPNGSLVPPYEDDGTDVFLAWPTQAEAKRGLIYQVDNYGVEPEAKVVQVK